MKKIFGLILVVFILSVMLSPLFAVDKIPYKKSQRPAVLVEKSDGIYKIKDMRWGFDTKDELSNPKWRTVTIDTNHVKKAILCVKIFPPEWMAGHALMLYRFDSNYPVKTTLGETSKGFFVSVEAHLRENQTYGILAGTKRQWPTIWQLTSYEDYIQVCSIAKRKMVMYELDMTQEMVKKMLINSIETSLEDRTNVKYHTFYESCYTSQVDMINSVVEKKRRLRRHFLTKYFFNPLLSLPRGIKHSLKKKKLLKRVYPVINPKEENKGDIATKEYYGENRRVALKNIAYFQAKSKKCEKIIVNGVKNDSINNKQLLELLYEESGEYSKELHIPGVAPEEKDNGETILGKNFGDSIKKAKTNEELISIIQKGFMIYNKGLEKRLLLEGPDVGKFLGRSLTILEKRSLELSKTGVLIK